MKVKIIVCAVLFVGIALVFWKMSLSHHTEKAEKGVTEKVQARSVDKRFETSQKPSGPTMVTGKVHVVIK